METCEMDEKYKRDVGRLLEKIKERDDLLEYINSRPFPPAVRAEKLRLLAKMTKHIDEYEQMLAKRYEMHQEICRLEEKINKEYEELDKMIDDSLEDMKVKEPELYAKIIASMEADNDDDDSDE